MQWGVLISGYSSFYLSSWSFLHFSFLVHNGMVICVIWGMKISTIACFCHRYAAAVMSESLRDLFL